jgi:hypothetical protein
MKALAFYTVTLITHIQVLGFSRFYTPSLGPGQVPMRLSELFHLCLSSKVGTSLHMHVSVSHASCTD